MATPQDSETGQQRVEIPGFRIFVGNLSYDIDTDKLKEIFASCGEM